MAKFKVTSDYTSYGICHHDVTAVKQKSVVDNHCKSQKHISNVNSHNNEKNKIQLTLPATQTVANFKKQVIEDLLEAFVIADISLEKVNSLLSFFKKHLKNSGSILQASTLWQIYLPDVFNKHYQFLKLLFDSKPVAIIMDETTDNCTRSVVNTIFTYQNKTKLVFVNFLERVNNAIMGQTFMIILTHFNISFNLPRLFLSDSATYIKKCYQEYTCH
ncbi:hypothetical protein Glove_103g128 [Diversispora epigaea]|uniref:Uncharacterized protein n=1 Tax=Diversispora epigaea TaxID=1348612 RepID=A0A397JA24_9GLOM|nr:hypothetical protein Glove_103g128 [Diversispora epigaea]